MTVPVSPTSKMSLESHTFMSFDQKVCRLIFNCLYEDFQAYLDKGLDPNYCLETDVSWEKEGIIFKKGSPLIFVVIRCCTVSASPWDLWMMINLLLEKGADLNKRVEYEGGGEIDVLVYACANADLINEEILCTLLKAASEEDSITAIEKIQDSVKKESIQRQLFPERFPQPYALSLTSPELLFSTSLPHLLIVDEEEICHCLIEGDTIRLRHLLESGISPDYVITKDVTVGDFVCKAGFSLLLLVLQTCVKNQNFFVVFENIALLLEKGADLEKECSGTTPLFYICENVSECLEEVACSFLSSVNRELAFCALNKIPDCECRQRMEKACLDLHPSMFPFVSKREEEEKILKIKEDLLAFGEKVVESSKSVLVAAFKESSLEKDILESSRQESLSSINSFFKAQSSIVVNMENYNASKASVDYGLKVNALLARILCGDFSSLEEILKTPSLIKEHNEEVKSLSHGRETLFSALIHKIKNPCTKHKICFLFLKYEFPKEEIVYKKLNLLSFLCSFRPGCRDTPTILMQTVFLAIFYYANGVLVEAALKECKTVKEREMIKSFFLDNQGNFSISAQQPINFVSNCSYATWIFAFLEISLIKNKDIITGNPWTGDIIFLFLNKIMKLMCNKRGMNEPSKKRTRTLLDLLEVLLLAGIHPNSYKEDSKEKYFSFMNQSFQFKDIKIQQEASFLIRKYWGSFFDKKEPLVYQNIFLKTFGNYTMNFGKVTDEISSAIERNNFTPLEEMLKNHEVLKKCNQEVKHFDSDETCFSVLLHKIKDPSLRHGIVCTFLKQGISLESIVYKELNVIQFLCTLRGNILLNTCKHLSLSTLCLALFVAKDERLIKTAVDSCFSEDSKRLKEFFWNEKKGSYSTKNLPIQKIIEEYCYYPLTKAFIEASILVNKDIITGRPWDIQNICSLVYPLIKKLSVGYLWVKETTRVQEKNIVNKNQLIHLYELLLISAKCFRFLPQENKRMYLLIKNKINAIRWKDADLKKNLLILLNRHLPVDEETRKRKGSFEEEAKETKLKQSSTFFLTEEAKNINLEKLDACYMYHDYGSKLESLLPGITYGNFGELEEILKDGALLNEYDTGVRSCRGHNETLFSALMHKLKDDQLQYKICCLFLHHGLSFNTIVFEDRNILSFCCSLNKFRFCQKVIKIICLLIFVFKNEISFKSVLEECLQESDRSNLKKFFVNDQGNFSVNSVNIITIVGDVVYAPLLESFVDASVLLNKNAITDEAWNCNIIFSLLYKLMESLCDMPITLGRFNIRKKNVLFSTLETLLLAAIHPNSYNEQNIPIYLFWLETKIYFKSPQIEQEVKVLIQKHWGYLSKVKVHTLLLCIQ